MKKNFRAGVFGASGLELTPDERAFFSEYKPFGLILFRRNCDSKEQVKRLVRDFRKAVDCECAPVMIDEEGGKIRRMQNQPYWTDLPSFSELGEIYEKNTETGKIALKELIEEIATRLKDCEINMVCSPVLDLRYPGASDVIGSRSFSENPETVAEMGQFAVEEFLNQGIVPVIKHLPGHGRAIFDSHKTVSEIDTDRETLKKTDFIPFRKLNKVPVAMSAHLIFQCLDAENPVTVSKKAIRALREELQFSGLLISDCLWMDALEGTHAERIDGAVKAGIDWCLYCHGTPEEMKAAGERMPLIDPGSSPFSTLFALLQKLQAKND